MRYLLPLSLVALMLSGCDPYRGQKAALQKEAELSAPCIAAAQTVAAERADANYRGFRLLDARAIEVAPGNYAVRIRYQDITLVDPTGGLAKRLDCELLNGAVVAIKDPPPI